jgi:hypothetical protein
MGKSGMKYCRDDMDLMSKSQGSNLLDESTFHFMLLEKWILCPVTLQTL